MIYEKMTKLSAVGSCYEVRKGFCVTDIPGISVDSSDFVFINNENFMISLGFFKNKVYLR